MFIICCCCTNFSVGIEKIKSVFEAGTPAIGETIGLGAAIDYLSEIGMPQIHDYEMELGSYLYDRLSSVSDVGIYGSAPSLTVKQAALFSFNVKDVHPTDIATFLDQQSGGECEIQRTMLELLNQLDGFDSRGDVKGTGVRVFFYADIKKFCYWVIANRTKIYIILEFITGGELFDKIPENLLLDSQRILKISNFGLSASPGEVRSPKRYLCFSINKKTTISVQVFVLLTAANDVLIGSKTTCGTPNYVPPEVLSHKGYDGAVEDI
ncbi:hypothetical protein FXO38_21157 [Capsicum annuum]|nr:hypothetical protein FXO38_21157 [Capsicum annuum]KAF3668989.1 hypothetical protein FXO37_09259 [Capsicum annuum]